MIITNKIEDLIPIYKKGGIFAYPTESVFGIGCNPDDEIAVHKILALKKRLIHKGLILIASDFSQVEKYLKPLCDHQKEFTQASETTYIYPALDSAPQWLTGDFDSLAVRITSHPISKKMCEVMGSALVSTSANVSGQVPAMSVEEVTHQLGREIDAVLSGRLGKLSQPSEIRDSISGEKIR